ncbi:MAG: hypothetical protein U1C96_00330 [Gallionella sp.]|nr:hypothetical protein [Gallionella sp.]
MSNRMQFMRAAWFLMVCWMTALTPAHAAWWEFGRNENEPAISELKFNQVEAARVEDQMVIGRDELQGGSVTIRGRAEVRKGEIGLIELTFDGGQTWVPAIAGDRGFFTYEFRPEINREYLFNIRAITTSGQSTDLDEHAFKLVISPESAIDEVKKTFSRLLEAYQRENKSAFMALVSNDFEGDLSSLEDAITDDFRFLDNIRIEPNITRLAPFGKNYDLYFTFNRSVTASRTGQQLRDNAASTMSFQRTGEGFKLVSMAAPLIFGVSNTEDVATSVTEQSVGQNVLSVNSSSGQAQTATQGQTTTGAIVSTATLTYDNTGLIGWYQQNFTFDTESVDSQGVSGPTVPTIGDFGFFGDNYHVIVSAAAQMVIMGNQRIEDVAEAPAGGYVSTYSTAPGLRLKVDTSARTFAFKLPGGAYAVVEFVALSGRTATFKYKYSPTGRQF